MYCKNNMYNIHIYYIQVAVSTAAARGNQNNNTRAYIYAATELGLPTSVLYIIMQVGIYLCVMVSQYICLKQYHIGRHSRARRESALYVILNTHLPVIETHAVQSHRIFSLDIVCPSAPQCRAVAHTRIMIHILLYYLVHPNNNY